MLAVHTARQVQVSHGAVQSVCVYRRARVLNGMFDDSRLGYLLVMYTIGPDFAIFVAKTSKVQVHFQFLCSDLSALNCAHTALWSLCYATALLARRIDGRSEYVSVWLGAGVP